MRKIVILLAFAFCQTTQAQQCAFEKSNGLESATYFEAIDWYKNYRDTRFTFDIIEVSM